MARIMTAEEKHRMMMEEPVERLISSLAVPTIVSMLVTSVYNMADTFFVSRISTSASGAVGIAFSVMAIIQAIGFTFGSGSGNYISRLLGRKDRQHAAKVAATGFLSAFGLGAVLAVLGLLFLDPLVYLLGATDTIAPYAKDYLRFILIGAPYMASSFVLNQVLRFQGSAYYGALGISVGGILNIILDPIFIFGLDMGIAGAAIATIISQLVSFVILVRNCGLDGNIHIRFKNFTPRWEIYRQIFRGGLPSFYRQTLASTAMIFLNLNAGQFGDAAIAAMAIINRVFMFAVSAVLGFGQGFQPVCGFNYGARRHDRVLRAFWFTAKTAIAVLIVLSMLGIAWAPKIMALFRKEDLEVISIGAYALRLRALTFPLSAWIIAVNMLLQTIGKSAQASLVAISRQGLFFLPAIWLLPQKWGLLGVQISQPVADICSFIVALVLGVSVLRELESRQREHGCERDETEISRGATL
jgi:putative MATE family efflux protein